MSEHIKLIRLNAGLWNVCLSYVHTCMYEIVSGDVKCISAGGHDQKNVKPLVKISLSLLGRFFYEAPYGKRKEEH